MKMNKYTQKQREYYQRKVKPFRKLPIEEKRKCNYCKKEFVWTSSSPQQIFCSKECSGRHHREIYNEKKGMAKPILRQKKIKCIWCGKSFIKKSHNNIFCSVDCRERSNEYQIELTKGIKKYKSTKLIKKDKFTKGIRKCQICKKKFTWTSSRPNQIYCSKECCKLRAKRMNLLKLRFEIFKRDNFTCQYCGRNVKEDNIKLHCDHIYPKVKGGLFIVENLTTSCAECNLGKKDVYLSICMLKSLSERLNALFQYFLKKDNKRITIG